jgi:germination protein M
MRRIIYSLTVLLLSLCLLSQAACGEKKVSEPEEEEGYQIYYINKEETAVVTEAYEPKGETTDQLLSEFIGLLQSKGEDADTKAAIPGSVSLVNYKLENSQLSLQFDKSYLEMDRLYEILSRSAIVRTLCQIPGVDYVSILVDKNPLTDSNGTPVGPMSADSFVENMGSEINTYTVTTLELYFANETGDRLVEETVDIRYSSNMSIEKLVLEQLIRGPITQDAYPTLPSDTKILSVSTKDGICYVNFDEGFLGQGNDVLESIPIYSVVNSLTEIPGIHKVQILINGETNRTFRETIRFDTIFERNLDLLEETE